MKALVTRSIGAAALMLAIMPAMTGMAEAKMKEMKFHIVQNEFSDLPAMEMKHDGSKWAWANKAQNFNIQVKVKLVGAVFPFSNGTIKLPDTGMELWKMPINYATKNLETLDSVTVGKQYLTPLQGKAAALCSVFGNDTKVIRDMPIAAELSVFQGSDVYRKKGTMPIKVVCQPKKEPQRVPSSFKVSDVKLYTIPAKPKCGKPVNLVAEFHANMPGKVDFQLFRRDGNKQAASVNIDKAGKGYAKRWSKTYNFSKSSHHEYMVIVKGHPFSVGWVPVEVNCGVKADQVQMDTLTQ
jgi:hypothetical protein